jgi:hypothetical protein
MGFIVLTITLCCMGFGYHKLKDNAVGAFVFLYCLSAFFFLSSLLFPVVFRLTAFSHTANFFQNFGPNTTTFVIPGEVFPTRYRSTAHGISAGSGKLGAIIAQIVRLALSPSLHTPSLDSCSILLPNRTDLFLLLFFCTTNRWLSSSRTVEERTPSSLTSCRSSRSLCCLSLFPPFFDKQNGMLTLFFFSLNRTGIFSTLLLPETKGKTLEELSGEDDQDHFISAPSGAERV